MPGLQELIAYLDQQKIPYAIASSSAPEDIRRMVEHAGFKISYKVLTSSKEGIPSKPAPDIFLAAAKALGVPAEECLVLEDSPNGLRAARAAGCKAVVVPDITPIPPESVVPRKSRKAFLKKSLFTVPIL